jgi:hypothetical protein
VTLTLVLLFIWRLGYYRTLWQSRGVRRLRRRQRVAAVAAAESDESAISSTRG